MHKQLDGCLKCIYIHVYKGKCLQFSAGDDCVPRRNGLEPEKVRKKESAVSTLATYFNVYVNNS